MTQRGHPAPVHPNNGVVVIPANAGIQKAGVGRTLNVIPAKAGMTAGGWILEICDNDRCYAVGALRVGE